MKALIWIGAILLLLILLALLRLRLTAVYGEDGPGLTVALGALPLLKLPAPKKPKSAKSEKKGGKQKKKKKKPAEEEKTSGGSEPGFRQWIPIIKDALGKLKRRLCIDELTLWYLSAAEDPATAALAFGSANAAAAALAEPLKELFRVRRCDLRAAVSFTETKPRVYARLRLSVALGVLLWIAARIFLQKRRARKKAGPKDTEESSWKSTRSEN